MLSKLIDKAREIYPTETKIVTEMDDLSDLDLLRLSVQIHKGALDDLEEELRLIKADYDTCEAQFELDLLSIDGEVKKGYDPNMVKNQEYIKSRFIKFEDSTLLTIRDVTGKINKAKETLDKSLDFLIKAVSNGDFKYKDYLSDTLGRSRASMPQIDSSNVDDLIIHFSGKSKVKKVKKKLSSLKMAQNEVNEDKVLDIMKTGTVKDKYVISKDNYILDGHHNFAAGLELDPDQEVTCYKVNLDGNELLRRTNLLKIAKKQDLEGNDIKKALDTIFDACDQGILELSILEKAIEEVVKKKKYDLKDLAKHAKKVGSDRLREIIDSHGDANLRIAAQKELDRRDKHEIGEDEKESKKKDGK